MTSFFETVAAISPLTKESREHLSAILVKKKAAKGQVIIKEGSVCNYLYYIEAGLTRTYYFKDGKYITDWISTEGAFACSIVSFISRKPDRRGIEALEDCILSGLPYYELEELCATDHLVERLVRKLLNTGLIQLQERIDDLHFTSALDRYTKLMNEHPTLVQRVPLSMLASYLGMTPETLSRVRNQL